MPRHRVLALLDAMAVFGGVVLIVRLTGLSLRFVLLYTAASCLFGLLFGALLARGRPPDKD